MGLDADTVPMPEEALAPRAKPSAISEAVIPLFLGLNVLAMIPVALSRDYDWVGFLKRAVLSTLLAATVGLFFTVAERLDAASKRGASWRTALPLPELGRILRHLAGWCLSFGAVMILFGGCAKVTEEAKHERSLSAAVLPSKS